MCLAWFLFHLWAGNFLPHILFLVVRQAVLGQAGLGFSPTFPVVDSLPQSGDTIGDGVGGHLPLPPSPSWATVLLLFGQAFAFVPALILLPGTLLLPC